MSTSQHLTPTGNIPTPLLFPGAPLLVAEHPPKPFMAVYRASASWLGSKPGKS